MGPRPLFSAFGIPVAFDPFFLFGAFLIYQFAGGGQRGTYYVVAMIGFVIVHEFGHALTAKAFGAQAAITISFLGGYASYAPTRTHTTRHQLAISLAGPLTQLLASLPVLWWSIDRARTSSFADSSSALNLVNAIGWAGVLLAFLNLMPLWPLDGGHIAEGLLRRLFGDGVMRPFLMTSLGLSAVSGVMAILVQADVIRPWFQGALPPRVGNDVAQIVLLELWSLPSLFFGGALFIPLVTAFASWGRLAQLNQAKLRVHVEHAPDRRELRHEEALRQARHAEREAWITGSIGPYPRGWAPSPWVLAHVALLDGRTDDATAALTELADGHRRDWVVDRPDRSEIGQLLAYVPAAALNSLAVLEARVDHGTPEDLVATATTVFLDDRSAEPLYLGAAGLAQRGLADEAMQWLRRAVNVAPDPHRMATGREFRSLHGRTDFQQLLGEAQRAGVS